MIDLGISNDNSSLTYMLTDAKLFSMRQDLGEESSKKIDLKYHKSGPNSLSHILGLMFALFI